MYHFRILELRGVEEQIARELGQWPERSEVEDTSSADIMAKPEKWNVWLANYYFAHDSLGLWHGSSGF